jgi:glycosyltransferase involved in cell wall biosynthesis
MGGDDDGNRWPFAHCLRFRDSGCVFHVSFLKKMDEEMRRIRSVFLSLFRIVFHAFLCIRILPLFPPVYPGNPAEYRRKSSSCLFRFGMPSFGLFFPASIHRQTIDPEVQNVQVSPVGVSAGPRAAHGGQGALRVAFAGGNGFPPEDTGGVQASTVDLAHRLSERGHKPAVLAPLYGAGAFGFRARVNLKFSRVPIVQDRTLGFPTYRAWSPEMAVDAFVARVRPDVAVVQCHDSVPIARAFRAAGVPVVLYFRNVEMNELGGDPSTVGASGFIANSRFTAGVYRQSFGLEATVIPPTIDAARFRVKSDRSAVVFVNPVPEKGLDRAIEIAAECPEIPFLFVESWTLSPEALSSLKARIAPYRNITFERRRDDVREVYGRARFLLAPSLWREAWGRVASEVQCSGLPVIGSDRGGLPEAIGPGGLVIPADAALGGWVAAVRRLWSDVRYYDEMSARALEHSERPDMNPEARFETFLSVITGANGATRAAI